MKLAGSEMDALRGVIAEAGADWKSRTQRRFHELVVARATAYLAGGHRALPSYEDRRDATRLDERFARLLGHTTLGQRLPAVAARISSDHGVPPGAEDSFLYWSKEDFGGKPVISGTHVAIVRHDDGVRPDVVIAGKGIFATHYVTASLGLTALVRGPGGQNYLAYLNHTEIDALGGLFGGLIRRVVEHRLASEATELLRGLRTRLESGSPPAGPSTAAVPPTAAPRAGPRAGFSG